jgi:hypothetical protein
MSQAAGVPPWVNQIMKLILHSPAHVLVSKTVLLISFTGRKSGKAFATPVSYTKEGEQVTIFTHATWWKNLKPGVPVTLRIKGQNRQGLPEVVAVGKTAIADGLAAHLRQVPSDARWYGVTFDDHGNPRAETVERAAETVVMVHFQLC